MVRPRLARSVRTVPLCIRNKNERKISQVEGLNTAPWLRRNMLKVEQVRKRILN